MKRFCITLLELLLVLFKPFFFFFFFFFIFFFRGTFEDSPKRTILEQFSYILRANFNHFHSIRLLFHISQRCFRSKEGGLNKTESWRRTAKRTPYSHSQMENQTFDFGVRRRWSSGVDYHYSFSSF